MKVNISVESLKDAILARILGSVASYYNGSESRVPYYLIRDEFKVTFNNFENAVNSMPNNYEKGQLVGVIESINRHAYGYSDRHDGMYVEVPDSLMNNQDVYESYALKAALEDVEKNDSEGEITGITPDGESDPIGGTQSSVIKALIDDMVSRVSSDVAKTTNTIIEIERTKNDQNKAALGVDDSAGEDELNLDDELGGDDNLDGEKSEDLTSEEGSDEFSNLTEGDTDLEKDTEDLDSILNEESTDDKKDKKDNPEDLTEGDSDNKEKKEDNPFNALESIYDSSLKNIKGLTAGTEDFLDVACNVIGSLSLATIGYAMGAIRRMSRITENEAKAAVLERKMSDAFKGLVGAKSKSNRLSTEEIKLAEKDLASKFNSLQSALLDRNKVSLIGDIVDDMSNYIKNYNHSSISIDKVDRPNKIEAGEAVPLIRFTINDKSVNTSKLDLADIVITETIFYYLVEGFEKLTKKPESVDPFIKVLASLEFPYDIIYDRSSDNEFDISIVVRTKAY